MPSSDESEQQTASPSVEAIIVTHDDPEAARRCARSILDQTVAVLALTVIDTAGARPASTSLAGLDPRVRVVRLDENLGPAGGWAAGLERFLAGDRDVAVLFDDDCSPRPSCVEELIAGLADVDVVQATMLAEGSGIERSTQGWCGVAVPRRVVEAVGVPDADLVWWTEDTEYLQWRIPRAGYRIQRSPDAIVEVSLRPERSSKPAWKYYYEARNQVAYRVRTQRPQGTEEVPRHLTTRVRWWRALRSICRLAIRAVSIESVGRAAKVRAVVAGAFDGLRGATGLRVPLGASDRARAAGARKKSGTAR